MKKKIEKKPDELAFIGFHAPVTVKEAAQKKADGEGRSLSNWLVRVLSEALGVKK